MILNENSEKEVIVRLLEYEDSITKVIKELREINVEIILPTDTTKIWDEIFGKYKDNDDLYDLVYVSPNSPYTRARAIVNTIKELRGADNDV